jgi:POT family proton-dependent oligopeptide transporter
MVSAMATPAAAVPAYVDLQHDRSFFGHPRGLATLFLTEMWERFSYYGMRAFLILYMAAPVSAGGLGFADRDAASIYGTYTGSVWGAAIVGGVIADRLLGQYSSVLLGGILIALGHLTLAFKSLTFFYGGLSLIVAGTGLLKPNVSTLVGALYADDDPRRDAGFSIFYMGINTGAFIGVIVAGYLAQRVDWHIGFASASVGMTIGIVQYIVFGRRWLRPAAERAEERKRAEKAATATDVRQAFTATEWKRISALLIFCLVATVFWAGYDQAGSTLNLFADRYTRLNVGRFAIPSSWLQDTQSLFVIILAPTFAWFWLKLGRHDPSTPTKIALGLMFMGLSFIVLVPAGAFAQGAPGGVRVSPWWLVLSYFISELGELCLYPVGLSAVTKLSPPRIMGTMMGIWFLSIAFGDKLAGYAAGFFSSMPLQQLFMDVAIALLITAAIMFVLIKPTKRLMAGVH